MHQDHNIPWNTLVSHLKFVEENQRVVPHRTDLFPRSKPMQGRELNYFVETLATTVEEFARTGRLKSPKVFETLEPSWDESTEKLAAAYETTNTPEDQQGGNGDADARVNVARLLECMSHQPEWVDELIALFEANHMEPLLALANKHPMDMIVAHEESADRSYVECGWVQLARYSFRAYMLINVIAETPSLIEGCRYKKLEAYKRLLRDLACDSLTTWHWHPHVRFLLGVQDRRSVNIQKHQPPEIFADYGKLRDYLSYCFRTLYKYRMLANECGEAFAPPYGQHFVRDTVWFLFSADRENPRRVGGAWKFV